MQIQEEMEQGVAGAVPIPPDYVGKELVISSLISNFETMTRTDWKVNFLKLLQVRKLVHFSHLDLVYR